MNRSTQNLGEQSKVAQNQREVARLMGQIEREHKMAVWAAASIPHEAARKVYIRHRYQAIGQYQEHLSQLVGKAQAKSLVQAAIERTPTPNQQTT